MNTINIYCVLFISVSCPEGSFEHPYKQRCFKVVNDLQTWKEADQSCKDMDALLAVIPNELTQKAIWGQITEQ